MTVFRGPLRHQGVWNIFMGNDISILIYMTFKLDELYQYWNGYYKVIQHRSSTFLNYLHVNISQNIEFRIRFIRVKCSLAGELVLVYLKLRVTSNALVCLLWTCVEWRSGGNRVIYCRVEITVRSNEIFISRIPPILRTILVQNISNTNKWLQVMLMTMHSFNIWFDFI